MTPATQPPNHPHPPVAADLTAFLAEVASGHTTCEAAMHGHLARAASGEWGQVFLAVDAQRALQAARAADLRFNTASPATQGRSVSVQPQDFPLSGVAISIKDLFDVQGEVTASGSRVLQTSEPAAHDCPAVARLRGAGAALVGRTNQSEFAFSGVGYNPHVGTPANPTALALGDPEPRITGGSSSGAAASVASGAAWVGLGSDTGGSIRIPAALCGLVGFKPTANSVPTAGAVPLSSTLDTVCAITRSVRDAVLVHQVLSGRVLELPAKTPQTLTLGIASHVMQDALSPAVQAAFDNTIAALKASGVQFVELNLPELAAPPQLQAKAGFSSSELMAWMMRNGVWEQRAQLDPRVLHRLNGALATTAMDYINLHHSRRVWIARMQPLLAGVDAVLSPTVPMQAPTVASISGAGTDDAFFKTNAALLRNPSLVNFLDGCAISIPCPAPCLAAGEMPVGLMLWHGAGKDAAVLAAAGVVERVLAGG